MGVDDMLLQTDPPTQKGKEKTKEKKRKKGQLTTNFKLHDDDDDAM